MVFRWEEVEEEQEFGMYFRVILRWYRINNVYLVTVNRKAKLSEMMYRTYS